MFTIGRIPTCVRSFFRPQRRHFPKRAWPPFLGAGHRHGHGHRTTPYERLNALLRGHGHRTNDGEFLWAKPLGRGRCPPRPGIAPAEPGLAQRRADLLHPRRPLRPSNGPRRWRRSASSIITPPGPTEPGTPSSRPACTAGARNHPLGQLALRQEGARRKTAGALRHAHRVGLPGRSRTSPAAQDEGSSSCSMPTTCARRSRRP